MSNSPNRRLPGLALLLALPAASLADGATHTQRLRAPLDPLLEATRAAGVWTLPSPSTLRAAETAFRRMLESPAASTHGALWSALGFEVVELTLGGRRFSFVREQAGRREGRGAYLFAHASSARWALQAPHVPSDLRTGRIAARLAVQGDFRVVAWNTLPRRVAGQGAGDTPASTDVTHVPGTWFSALARAYAAQFPDGRVLELHGFDPAQRRSASARGADFIVSPAHRGTSAAASAFADCLAATGLGKVLRFPTEIGELGGTTNVNARLLHALGFDGFIHLEIAPAARELLARRRSAREELLKCLR